MAASDSELFLGNTIRINSSFVKDSNGNLYELRYDPDGSTIVVGYENVTSGSGRYTYTERVTNTLYTSSPGTSGTVTDKGSAALSSGLVLVNSDGTETALTKETFINKVSTTSNLAHATLLGRFNAQERESLGSKPPVAPNINATEVPPPVEEDSPEQPNNDDGGGGNSSGENPLVDAPSGVLDSAIEFGVDLFNKASGAIKNIPGIENLTLNADLAKEFQFGNKDKSTIVNYAQYPIDALYGRNKTGVREAGKNMQDHVSIYQYSYKPPKSDLIFGGNGIKTIKEGTARKSPLKDFIGLVKLPMPNDISDSNNISWGEDAMNNLSAAMTSAVVGNPVDVGLSAAALGATLGALGVPGGAQLGAQIAMLSGVSGGDIRQIPSGLGEILNSSGGRVLAGSAVASRLLALGGVQVSPESILARGYGIIPNSNMELLFNAPTLRQFQFNWKMTARSKDEAFKIRQIIRFFKQGMAAKKVTGAAGGASTFLGTPNVFKLKYKTINLKTLNDQDIEGVNRLKVCAVTGCSVNYTPGGSWSAYEDGQPVSTIMTLRMQELEPIFDTDYQEVTDSDSLFVGGIHNKGNLDSIRGTRNGEAPYDVGY